MPAEVGAWVEFFRTFGVAAPLVGFLVFIYNKSDTERRETQTRFLGTLETTIANGAADRQANTAATLELNATIRERGVASTAEHEKMLAIMHKMLERLERLSAQIDKLDSRDAAERRAA